MQIQQVPKEFQPRYLSFYPSYSCGKSLEEIYFELIKEYKDVDTEYVYLPVFWTSYYNQAQNFGSNRNKLCKWLNSLDKTKKYFTIVQHACGILVSDYDLNLTVFSAGGAGVNIFGNKMLRTVSYNGLNRACFYGNKGKYTIPLLCKPLFPSLNLEKDIFCSFMGRFDTHKCRMDMKKVLKKCDKIKFFDSKDFGVYKKILNRSVFTLAPRGFGYTSFRLGEAILADSIPIYIWEDKKVLPFEDELEWKKFCIVIHSGDIEKLPEILENVNVKEMQQEIRNVKYKFMFEETCKYIITKLV